MKKEHMKAMWDTRYRSEEYAYGEAPNNFFKACIDTYKPSGNILLPGEGEGRNGVYAAQAGLKVYAFDLSEQGRSKALVLAEHASVHFKAYEVGSFEEVQLMKDKYDVLALFYMHIPPELMMDLHRACVHALKPNGLFFLEGFSENQLELCRQGLGVGGPDNPDMLYTKEKIRQYLAGCKELLLDEVRIELEEGTCHSGQASVIRYVGRKNL